MEPSWNFEGRTAIVTGGARGIGLAMAVALESAGAETHVFDRQSGENGVGSFHEVDVADPDSVASAIASLASPATLLVNNAGITRDRTIAKMSDSEWHDVIDVNLSGAFNVLRAAVGPMAEAGGGAIVNITSINGLRGKFGQANYSAAKAGLIGLTKAAARELGAKGIRVNAVAPGMVLTEMALELPEQFRDAALAESVTGRLTEPGDVAQAVLFLLSGAARSITGEVLRVDCGQYI